MKYKIEGTYEDDCMKGCLQVQEADPQELKDFIMKWMPALVQDLFDRLWQALTKEAEEKDISFDKVTSALTLIGMMTITNLSDKLTGSVDKFLGQYPDEEEKEKDPRQILTN